MKKILFIVIIMSLVLPVMAFAGGNATSNSTSNAGSESLSQGGGATINSFPNYQQPQNIYPYLLQLIPGVVADITDTKDMPDFYVIQPLRKGEQVLRVEPYTRGGRIAGFSRLEDFDQDLLCLVPKVMKLFGQSDTSRIRFRVIMKMSSKSIGANLGSGGSTAGFGGGMNPMAYGANGTGIGAVAVNTADPKIVIKFYLITPIPTNYEKEGWHQVK